jgi:hypothetical protein
MPANQLEAALFLEADRMRSLAIVKDNLDNQRRRCRKNGGRDATIGPTAEPTRQWTSSRSTIRPTSTR